MPSKRLLDLSGLRSIKKFVRKNKANVEDAILIGSTVKGKRRPTDIDIVLLLKNHSEKTKLVGELGEIVEAHISAISLSDIFREPLWRPVIHEGYSIVRETPVAEILGFRSAVFMEISPKMRHTDRVRFNYALRGRKKGEGILTEASAAEKSNMIEVPTDKEAIIEEFLEFWGVKYKPSRALLW